MKTYLPHHVHGSIYNSQDTEATSASRHTNKEDMTHIHDGVLFRNKKNELLLFVITWMNLDGIRPSEISQIKTNTV